MYQTSSLLRTLFIASVLFPFAVYGQLPPLQPEQDCVNALPVCQSIFVQPNSYQGAGVDPNEINPFLSCLGSGEKNDVWYIFTVQTAGNLCFSITPNLGGDDYDWALYNLTNHSCSDIPTNGSLEVSCNFAPNLGCGGITGANGQTGGFCGGQNESCVPVVVGQTFVLNVSNYSSTNFGYTLDFSASTAVIFDNIPPQMDSVSADCGATLSLQFSENVVCPSVQTTDFVVSGPLGTHTVTAVSGTNCAAGGSFEDQFDLTLNPPISAPGMYYISVVDTILDNCDNVALYTTDSVLISFPNLNASASADSVCAGDSVLLSTPSTIGYTYSWSNGAAGPSTYVIPLTTSNYIVSAVDAFGCVYSGNVTVHVIPTPTADFSFATPSVCVDEGIGLLYTGNALPAANFNWNFGSASVLSGNGAGPYQLAWSSPGTQNVSLTVDQLGCPSLPFTQNIIVHAIPTADFNLPVQTCSNAPTLVSYNGSASAGASYNWDFDGGIILSGSGAGPYQIEWAIPGPKDVNLIVIENNCTSLVEEQQIMVQALAVNSIQTVADQCFDGNNFNFQFNGPGTPASYSWDFGDGSPQSSVSSPNHTYGVFGPQTVSLLITDQNGCQSTTSQSFTIHPPVNADFNFPAVCEGMPTAFINLSSIHPSGSIAQYNWQFGDGNNDNSSSPSHLYASDGSFSVKLIATSDQGCTDSISKLLHVYDQPNADFSFENQCQGYAVPFTDLSQYDNPSLTYQWTLGDGNTQNTPNPQHLYNSFGTYNVSLKITNSDGCSDVATQSVVVHPLPVVQLDLEPVCRFEHSPLNQSSYVPAGGTIISYRWKLDQGRQLNGPNPSPQFSQPGSFPIRLIVTSDQGCVDSLNQDLIVNPTPKAVFEFQSACLGEAVSFQSRSTIEVGPSQDFLVDWQWDFGDGQNQGGQEITQHTYTQPGVYPVQLTAVSEQGCESSFQREVKTYALPTLPELVPDTVCFGETALLLALPTSEGAEVFWYESSDARIPFHAASALTIPSVTYRERFYVEAVSAEGCVSERIPVSSALYQVGQGQISMSARLVELPEAFVQFSVSGPLQAASYAWNFGDGTRSDEAQPTHRYTRAGRYEVSVIVSTPEGCERLLQETVEVKAPIGLYIPSAFTPNGDGFNDEYYLGTHLLQAVRFQVYNRWGLLVYETEQVGFRWTGHDLQGQMLSDGVYAYKIQALDIEGKMHKRAGTITIVK